MTVGLRGEGLKCYKVVVSHRCSPTALLAELFKDAGRYKVFWSAHSTKSPKHKVKDVAY